MSTDRVRGKIHWRCSIDCIIGGQYGSEGKGNVASCIAHRADEMYTTVCALQSPNAGHTWCDRDGGRHICRQLPVISAMHREMCTVYPQGAVINLDILKDEIEQYHIDPRNVWVHPRACIISDDMIQRESETLQRIASTLSGSGAARAARVMREQGCVAQAHRDTLDAMGVGLIDEITVGGRAIIETSQGYGLSVDSEHYPYCTSRMISVGAYLSDAGAHPCHLGDVHLVNRVYPIRVGNAHGYSGDVASDAHEMTWDELGLEPEYTTVTNNMRRVFSWSWELYNRACDELKPRYRWLTHADTISDDELREMTTGAEWMGNPFDYMTYGGCYTDVKTLREVEEQWRR